MLVISRREEEKIFFPQFSTTVKILSAKPGRVSIGIDAPKQVKILRHEIANCDAFVRQMTDKSPDPLALLEFRNALRNRLNAAIMRWTLLQTEYNSGDFDSLGESLEQFGPELQRIKGMLDAWDAGASRSEGGRAGGPLSPKLKRRRRVMLVEDDDNECTLLAGFLRQTGHEVVTANDGADALELLTRCERPDVVLMDMMLPRLDGAATISRIRANPELSDLRIFVVSGHSPSDFATDAGLPLVDGWIAKPLDPEALLANLSPGAGTAA